MTAITTTISTRVKPAAEQRSDCLRTNVTEWHIPTETSLLSAYCTCFSPREHYCSFSMSIASLFITMATKTSIKTKTTLLLFKPKSFSRCEVHDFLARQSAIKDVNFIQGTIKKARSSVLRTKINRQFAVACSGGTTNSPA